MNTFKAIALAICVTFITSLASAAEKRIGLSANFMDLETVGSETLRQSSNVTKASKDEDAVVPSIFVEVVNDSGLGIGLDYVPVAELGSGTGQDDDAETSGANKASAELAAHVTVYLIAESSMGLYLKAGYAMADVDTTENLKTGDKYGNSDTTGTMVAIGYKYDLGSAFVRADVSSTDYDEVSIKSTGGSTVKADVDATAVTLSIGKAF